MKTINPNKYKFLLIATFLITGLLLHAIKMAPGVRSDIIQIAGDIGQSGLWRSANFSQGNRFANYVTFLNQRIPEDAVVILPMADVRPNALSRTPFMQFFLSPRQVINCTDQDCLGSNAAQTAYVLVVDDFPRESIVDLWDAKIMFDSTWGILVPASQPADQRPASNGFSRLEDILIAALGPILWLLLIITSGLLIIRHLASHQTPVTMIVLGYGLGLCIYTLLITGFSLLGLKLDRSSVFTAMLVMLIASIVIHLFAKSLVKAPEQPTSQNLSFDPWLIMILILGVIASILSVGQGYHTTDAIQLWGAKGYGIAADGSILTNMDWGTNTVAYPLHIPILIATFRIMSFEALPGSKMLFSGYFIGLVLFFYQSLLWGKVNRTIAGLASLLIATTPVLLRHGTIAYANLPLSFYLFAAVILLIQSTILNNEKGNYKTIFLAGLFFAFSAWTRPEGIILSLLCMILIVGTFMHKVSRRILWRPIGLVSLPMILYGLFWSVVKELIYTRPVSQSELTQNALAEIFSGELHLSAGLYVLRSYFTNLLTYDEWGVFGVLLFIAVLIFTIPRLKHNDYFLVAFLTGILLTLTTLGIYYLTSYDAKHDIGWWVNTGLNRMLFPGVLLMWFGSIGAVQAVIGSENKSPDKDIAAKTTP